LHGIFFKSQIFLSLTKYIYEIIIFMMCNVAELLNLMSSQEYSSSIRPEVPKGGH
jgi:hypothetical protein